MTADDGRRMPPTAPPRRRARPSAMTLVIYFVGATLLVSSLAMFVLALREQPVPDGLGNLSVGSLAALAGLLAKRDADS